MKKVVNKNHSWFNSNKNKIKYTLIWIKENNFNEIIMKYDN